MRFLWYVAFLLFNLSLNSFPLAWADRTTLPKFGTAVKSAASHAVKKTVTAVVNGVEKASEMLVDARLTRMQDVAHAQWKSDHKKRFLRTKVNMMQDEKPEFILFFAHGYRPKTSGYGYPREKATGMIAPFLRSFRYVMYHPLLSVGPAYTTFAQKDDIDQLKFHFDRVVALVRDPQSVYFGLPIVCVGHSNGASTFISLFGTYPEVAKSISLAVLFAPYADVRKTKYFHTISEKKVGSYLSKAGVRGAGVMYDPKQKAPIDFIKNNLFPRDLPVFLVHAQDDPYIPLVSNFTIFSRAFRAHGYEPWLHLFAFENGGHGQFLLRSKKEDRQKLRDSLRRFITCDVLKRPFIEPAAELSASVDVVEGSESKDLQVPNVLIEQMMVDARGGSTTYESDCA